MQSQYGPTSAGKGHENRRPWVQKEAPQVKFRPPGGPLESSWGVLGAESASEERSGRKRGVSKKLWRALGTTLGSSWRVLGPFWVAFPPPLGGPGEAPGGHFFDLFWDAPAEILKMSCCLLFFTYLGSSFCAIIYPLLSSLLRGWRRHAYAKT